jgi:hypothetical protein
MAMMQNSPMGPMEHPGRELQQVLLSQHEVCAFASLVIASLPFPPLPVLVLQGEDGEYGTASSFDLLQQAIVVQQLGCVPSGDLELVRAKKEILERLRTDMTAHYESAATCNGPGSICSPLWVERAYDIYCDAFRNYLLRNYATCTQDLRFHHADTVPADSVLVRQGTSHWKASRLMSGECTLSPHPSITSEGIITPETAPAGFSSYTQMLRSYAVDLATLPEA